MLAVDALPALAVQAGAQPEEGVVDRRLAAGEVGVHRRRAEAHPPGDLVEVEGRGPLLAQDGPGGVEDGVEHLLAIAPPALSRREHAPIAGQGQLL